MLGCTPERTTLVTEAEPSCADDQSSSGSPHIPVTQMQAVGDSILGWNQETAQSIPDVVGTQLDVAMQNHATGGATLGGAGIAELYEPSADSHVLVNGGGNDFAEDCSTERLDQLITPDLDSGWMMELVDLVTEDGGQAVIVGYYLPRDRQTGCAHFPELQQRYRALAEQREDTVYVCTLETITPETPERYADSVHPSVAGSEAIGALVADFLRGP